MSVWGLPPYGIAAKTRGGITRPAPPNPRHPMNAMTRLYYCAALLASVLALDACSSIGNLTSAQNTDTWRVQRTEQGKASFYSTRCNGGSRTASGERLQNDAPTAAHKTLPMGTKVRVVNLANGMSEIVTINDRGPYIGGRIIDVTIGVARRLGFVSRGIVPVRIEVLGQAERS